MLKKYKLRSYNFILVFILIITSVFALAVVNSANSAYTMKQGAGMVVSFVIMIIVLSIFAAYGIGLTLLSKHSIKFKDWFEKDMMKLYNLTPPEDINNTEQFVIYRPNFYKGGIHSNSIGVFRIPNHDNCSCR